MKLEEDPPLLSVTVGFNHLYACHADRQQDYLVVSGQKPSSSHFAFAFRDTETT